MLECFKKLPGEFEQGAWDWEPWIKGRFTELFPRRLFLIESFSCDQLTSNHKKSFTKIVLKKHLHNNRYVFKIKINQYLLKPRGLRFHSTRRILI